MTLEEFFKTAPRAAAAFSGGADSAFLLWAAARYGCDVHAYYIKTAFQPEFELEDARRLARQLNVPLTVIEKDILSVPEAAANGPDRCYHCKQAGAFYLPVGSGAQRRAYASAGRNECIR